VVRGWWSGFGCIVARRMMARGGGCTGGRDGIAGLERGLVRKG
jgi:hypothetical protein